jgi:hypothetical protein
MAPDEGERAIRLMASHPCHSRQTGGLTGNPGYRPRTSGFPIGRFAAVGNDIDDWLAERRDIVRVVSATFGIVWAPFSVGQQLFDENQKLS